jgi:hypothetical protein
MHIHSVDDLRLMSLERIAIETPEATARLFELRDAGKWQSEYRVSADWLNQFLRGALEQEQEHVNWVTEKQ